MIRTKARKLVPLRPNPVQVKFLNEVAPGWRLGKIDLSGLREIILKARQQGFSTIIEALIFCDTINTPHTYSVIVAHKRSVSTKIFRMVKIFYDHLPPHKKRPTKYASKYEFYWEDINSSFYVGSAEDRDFGRGDTINNAHLTEIPSWPDPDETIPALLETVPDDGFVAMESTAKGLGNYFHETWNEATEGQSNFRPTFSPWFDDPTNRRKVPEDFVHDQDELALIETFGLDDEQLAWRRSKKKDLKEKFPQEHPATAEEAFLTSGNPYFNRGHLQKRNEFLIANPTIELSIRPESSPKIGSLKDDALIVYCAPEPGKVYVIGADPSEGLNQKGTDHDYSAADVFEAESGVQAATLHGRWTPREFGFLLAELGWWYGTALLCIERNNHGHAVINTVLYEAGYPEQKRTNDTGVYLHQEYDVNRIPAERRPGFPTTSASKGLCDDDLASAIEENELLFHSRSTLRELMRYVKLPGGKAGGEGGSHDDRVRSIALAQQMLKLRPRGRRGALQGASGHR